VRELNQLVLISIAEIAKDTLERYGGLILSQLIKDLHVQTVVIVIPIVEGKVKKGSRDGSAVTVVGSI